MSNMKGTVNIHHATSVQLVKREWKGSYWLDITISSPGGEFEVSVFADDDIVLDSNQWKGPVLSYNGDVETGGEVVTSVLIPIPRKGDSDAN